MACAKSTTTWRPVLPNAAAPAARSRRRVDPVSVGQAGQPARVDVDPSASLPVTLEQIVLAAVLPLRRSVRRATGNWRTETSRANVVLPVTRP